MKVYFVHPNGVKTTHKVKSFQDVDDTLNKWIRKYADKHDASVAVMQKGRVFILSLERYGRVLIAKKLEDDVIVEPVVNEDFRRRYPKAFVANNGEIVDWNQPKLQAGEYGFGFYELEVKRVIDRLFDYL